ncbi:Uncharacterised protein [Mycobacteroides abscessus subsp. abscessus]|uniref:hypothetical protein n=1 Tax=Mycobacteroides abscessus TaxID=36809 RepID=UPI00092949A0|nr:hypothetical protein [Mycobacteroides abscessus]SHU28806.1 Uncharacterised protein [Mycobacteroides abscessus subsp. abscessus]
MRILVENHYEDGHASTFEIEVNDVEEPTDFDEGGEPMEELWAELNCHTGDGHGIGARRNLGYCCTVTILAADSPELVGKSHEWVGN